MARIRSIKPEFPQSESMGRVSRDARLTFIQLWTLADDEGRLRGNSRMLASLLFPYDDDAKDLIDGWLNELEAEHCIDRYQVNGDNYIQVANWLIHQKIDKPSKSKIPAFDESSRILANVRELSSLDQGSRIKDQGIEEPPCTPQGGKSRQSKTNAKTFRVWIADMKAKPEKPIPEGDPVFAYCAEVGLPVEFLAYHWREFKAQYMESDKRYADWRRVLRMSVRRNWFRLWLADRDGSVRLTTAGEQARRSFEAEHREAA